MKSVAVRKITTVINDLFYRKALTLWIARCTKRLLMWLYLHSCVEKETVIYALSYLCFHPYRWQESLKEDITRSHVAAVLTVDTRYVDPSGQGKSKWMYWNILKNLVTLNSLVYWKFLSQRVQFWNCYMGGILSRLCFSFGMFLLELVGNPQ